MSSSDRRTFLALAFGLPLAACGFTPAYGPAGPAHGINGQVWVDDPKTKDAFDLVERLEERLGRSRQPRYKLSYQITTRTEGQAITPDNSITRYQIIGSTSFALRDAATNAVLTEGSVDGFTAYSAVGTRVESESSRADAQVRLMRILADKIATQLIATSGAWNKP